MTWTWLVTLFLLCCISRIAEGDDNQSDCYLLYDVNPGEGFNLRRDVYMRVAALNNLLNCTLVLPPWDHLYHWQTKGLGYQGRIPWSKFFDLKQMSYYTPVIELENAVDDNWTQGYEIDVIIHLQHPSDLNGNYLDQAKFVTCKNLNKFWKEEDGTYGGPFWSYENIYARKLRCVELLGGPSILAPLMKKMLNTNKARKIFLDRAETLLHDQFGRVDYWRGRRSMRFARHLVKIADKFREDHLDSSDENDGTRLPADWRDENRGQEYALGGPYIAAHLRRKDFWRQESQMSQVFGKLGRLCRR